MTDLQREILTECGVDLDGAIYRFGGSEEIYVSCLNEFLKDGSMAQFCANAKSGDWEKACTAAHTLKGVAGNMGFVRLMHAAQQTVYLLREKRIAEAEEAGERIKSSYGDIVRGIELFLTLEL